MARKMEDTVIFDDKLEKLVCKARNIDAEEYPQMSELINRFLGLDPDCSDYRKLADDLMNADPSRQMPKEVIKLIITIYENEIEAGDDAMAANNLGALYYGGRIGGEPDYKNARKYYEISARLGYPLAAENLAYIFYYGFGTEVDYEKAYLYFSKAALYGRHEAMYKLGDMFRYGYYVEKDDKMTAFCYRRSAEFVKSDSMSSIKCHGSIYHRLGDIHYEGIGVEKDLRQALFFYQLAETKYYDQIEDGDKYHVGQVAIVIDKQKKIRRQLQKTLPVYEF